MLTRKFFGCNTAIQLSCYGEPFLVNDALVRAQKKCEAYEALFSRTIDTSDIARINRAKGGNVAIDPQTAEVLLAACNYCEISGGVFDITVGPLVSLWNFREGSVPEKAALREAATHVDWRQISIWQKNDQWFCSLEDASATLDLGGIAKGWIADRLVNFLLSEGASGALVDLGGNIAVGGVKDNGYPWRVGIRDPRSSNPQSNLYTVELQSGSVVTSGTYERGFTYNGLRYHHILNPKTGMPASVEAESVSIVADTSLAAEGFSTTFLILGPEKSRTLAVSYPEIRQAYFIYPDNSIHLLYP